jgi:hypothetical protein
MLGNEIADITVCTATIPIRKELLERAKQSVINQTLQPKEHIIKTDVNKLGHAKIIDSIVEQSKTKYIAILDDDDEFLPDHIESLYNCIEQNNADLVYPHFKYATSGNGGHLEKFFNVPWDNANPHQVPLTWICRKDIFLECGGFSKDYDPLSYNVDSEGNRIGHDFLFIQRLAKANKKIVHLPKVTWIYHDDRVSTLGMPNKW